MPFDSSLPLPICSLRLDETGDVHVADMLLLLERDGQIIKLMADINPDSGIDPVQWTELISRFSFKLYWVSPKPDIICCHISAGSHPDSLMETIIFCIMLCMIFDIILGIALVARTATRPPPIAPNKAIRK